MRNRYADWPAHLILIPVSVVMLIPFYWVLKTSITGENIFAYPPALLPENPHLFNYVDAWYSVPFATYFVNSIIVVFVAIIANILIDAAAGYALTFHFRGKRLIIFIYLSCMMIPFQATIIPAYLITARLGLVNTLLGIALPHFSHIILIFIFKASFDALPRSLTEAARMDGVPEWRILLQVMLPLVRPAIATSVVLTFIWSWNDFLWPLIVVRDASASTLPLGLARFLSYFEDTTAALYAFVVMSLVPGILVFFLAQRQFIEGLTAGAGKG